MTCNCLHCLEIKKQVDRAEQRQSDILKSRSTKINIKQDYAIQME